MNSDALGTSVELLDNLMVLSLGIFPDAQSVHQDAFENAEIETQVPGSYCFSSMHKCITQNLSHGSSQPCLGQPFSH